MTTLEICAASLNSALIASQAGADRIELCSALSIGGLTPGIGLISTVIELSSIPVHVLIRPRAGNFCYSDFEKRSILKDIHAVVKAGVHGIVVGTLDKNAQIDVNFLNEMKYAAAGIDCTFHRAFDLISNKRKAIDLLAELGFIRILTSGGAVTAWEGRNVLKECVEYADNKIEIMAGSGINSENVRQLVEFTGVKSIHASAGRKHLKPCNELFPPEPDTDPVVVNDILNILKKLS